MSAYTYITTSQVNGTLYIGATTNLKNRIKRHRLQSPRGFTNRYTVDRLVHFEIYPTVEAALTRERQLKKWNRDWKIKLIETQNPSWKDLYQNI